MKKRERKDAEIETEKKKGRGENRERGKENIERRSEKEMGKWSLGVMVKVKLVKYKKEGKRKGRRRDRLSPNVAVAITEFFLTEISAVGCI